MEIKPLGGRLGTYVLGSLVGGRPYKALIPPPLPPDPPVALGGLYNSIDQATRALALLDASARLLPDISFFLYLYVRKEALLSSQIEGTQSSLSDLLLFENNELPSVPLDDVQEVSNYVAALYHGLERIRGGFPLCSRLLKETHEVLLSTGRGRNTGPGEFRGIQNWIGGNHPGNATYVPPPPEGVEDLMENLERFLHDDRVELPILVRAAVAHAQFETIHPFLDGNGRVGRLLITLLLCEKNAIKEPLLYLSLFFKTHRSEYYEHLMRVRTHGEWEEWVGFFLQGVTETAGKASKATSEILQLFENDRKEIAGLGRAASSALRIHAYLQKNSILIVPRAINELSLSAPTIRKSIRHLEKLGIVTEMTGKGRGRIYLYKEFFGIMEEGTEPIRG